MLIYIPGKFPFYVRTCRAPRGRDTQFIHIKNGWGVEAPREIQFYKVAILQKNAAWKWLNNREFIAKVRPLGGHLLLEWRTYGESIFIFNPLLVYDSYEFSVYLCSFRTRNRFYRFSKEVAIDLEKCEVKKVVDFGPCESNKRTVKPDLTVGYRNFYGFADFNGRRLPIVGIRDKYENAIGVIEETRVMLYEEDSFERGVPLQHLPKLECINEEDEGKYYIKIGEENIYIPPEDIKGLEKLLIKEKEEEE